MIWRIGDLAAYELGQVADMVEVLVDMEEEVVVMRVVIWRIGDLAAYELGPLEEWSLPQWRKLFITRTFDW